MEKLAYSPAELGAIHWYLNKRQAEKEQRKRIDMWKGKTRKSKDPWFMKKAQVKAQGAKIISESVLKRLITKAPYKHKWAPAPSKHFINVTSPSGV